jgi:hypothetical protein
MNSRDFDYLGCTMLLVLALIVVVVVAIGILVGYLIWGGA